MGTKDLTWRGYLILQTVLRTAETGRFTSYHPLLLASSTPYESRTSRGTTLVFMVAAIATAPNPLITLSRLAELSFSLTEKFSSQL